MGQPVNGRLLVHGDGGSDTCIEDGADRLAGKKRDSSNTAQ